MPITLSSARSTPSAAAIERIFSAVPANTQDEAPSLTGYLQKMAGFGSRVRFGRGETIFSQDDACDQVYRIVSGTVRLCRYMPDGRRCIVDFLMPGDLMGFVETAAQPVSAEAVTEVTVCAYPRACFDRLVRENTEVRDQLLSHISSTLLTAHQHLFVLGCQKAKERLASFLLRMSERTDLMEGERLDLSMSRQDIADHLGVTIETISRMVAALRADGVILIPNPHQLIVRDMDALRSLATEG